MFSILSAMTGLETVFVACALFGGGLFIARLVLLFFGIGHGDVDSAGGIDASHGGLEHHASGDSDISFKMLSLQGVTAFFMMFGLVGLAMLRQSKLSMAISLLGAVAGGVITVWIIKKLFSWAGTLQSSGTLNLYNAVGCEGTVYLTIHPGQAGKVQVSVQGRLAELDARSESDVPIRTGESVRVINVVNNILVVQKI